MESDAGCKDGSTPEPTTMGESCHFDVLVFDLDDAQEFLEQATQWRFPEHKTTYVTFTLPNNAEGGLWVHPALAPRVVTFYKVTSVSDFMDSMAGAVIPLDEGDHHPRDNNPYAIFVAPTGQVLGVHEE